MQFVNDGDWFGAGDMDVRIQVNRVCATCEDGRDTIVETHVKFDANAGEVKELNRVIPSAGDTLGNFGDVITGTAASVGTGIPVYDGERYYVALEAEDDDPFLGDPLGGTSRAMSGPGWGTGTYTDEGKFFGNMSFWVNWEIRRVSLPDLVAHNLTQFTASNGAHGVRMIMQNVGERDADPFQLSLRMDGANEPLVTYDQPLGLAAGATADAFYFPQQPLTGQHQFLFTIDSGRSVAEMDETNNALEERIALQPMTAGSQASPARTGQLRPSTDLSAVSAGSSDLLIRAIRVKSGEPGGSTSCEAGKNDVTVVVKNQGNGSASNVVVRLATDGDTMDKSVGEINADKELTMTFEDVPLTKGEHKLTAVVDPKDAIDEVSEGNNEMRVSVSCKG
jgi:hypothetical protein